MKVVINVVTYEGRRYIEPLFRTLKRYTNLDNVAIVVVDNASSDGTLLELERMARSWPNLHLLPQTENTGFARGSNIGIQKARELGAEYCLLLNQDLEVTEGWLAPLLKVMKDRPEVAAAQPLILLHSDPERLNSAGNELHFCGFGYCGNYRRTVSSALEDNNVRSVAFASGAALMLRMEALNCAGDFDERLFMYHEDAELQVRLRQLGYDCVVVPEASVLHKYKATFSTRKYALLERNRWLLMLKDWPTSRLLASAPALVGVELAVLFFAARQGWLGEKLQGYQQIARLLPQLAIDRREIKRRLSRRATDATQLTGALHFEGLDHPVITRLANPALSFYWTLLLRLGVS